MIRVLETPADSDVTVRPGHPSPSPGPPLGLNNVTRAVSASGSETVAAGPGLRLT